MSKIDFCLSKEDYYNLAEKAFKNGDVEKSVVSLKKALSIDSRYFDAYALLCDVYSSIDALDISNEIAYKALAKHPRKDYEQVFCFALAKNFVRMRKFDVADYYLRDMPDDFDFSFADIPDGDTGSSGRLKIISPKGEGYYESLVDKAYDLIKRHEFDEAIKLMDSVPLTSKSKPAADHIVLVCLMMKNDIDGVIDNAKKMLKDTPDSLATKCTLATAYLIEEKTDDAYMMLDDILKTDYTEIEDILMLLPLLVNLDAHVQIVKYTKRVLEKLGYQMNTMMWLSQALYNIGQKDEARKVMVSINTIYEPCFASKYFLNLYRLNPDSIQYSINLPYTERLRIRKAIAKVLELSEEILNDVIEHDVCICSFEANGNTLLDITVKDLFEWAFMFEDEQVKFALVDKIAGLQSDCIEEMLRKQLLLGGLSFDLTSRIICILLERCPDGLSLDIVSQDRFKSTRIVYPRAFGKMTKNLDCAYAYCVADIIYADEDQDTYLYRLKNIINDLADVEDGKTVYKNGNGDKIVRMKSLRTLIGVLLYKVYEGDMLCDMIAEDGEMYEARDVAGDMIDRFGLDPQLFDKYMDILFGDNND